MITSIPEPRFASVDTCSACEREYGSYSPERSALVECDFCTNELCRFCVKRCDLCKQRICQQHAVVDDDSTLCTACDRKHQQAAKAAARLRRKTA